MKIFKKIKELESKILEQANQIASLEGMLEGFNKGTKIIVENLQDRIEAIEFLQKNPSGIRRCRDETRRYGEPVRYGVEYVKNNKLKRAYVNDLYRNEDVSVDMRGNTMIIRNRETGDIIDKLEFDIRYERFVSIREVATMEV